MQRVRSMGLKNRILVFLLVIGLVLCLIPFSVTRAADDSSVTISVGYFGTPYMKVADMTVSEMKEELEFALVEDVVYSTIDSGGFTRYNLASGVRMDELLQYVEIETNDIEKIYFHGADGYYKEVPDLFAERYYYPYLAANYNGGDPSEEQVAQIEKARTPVPAILAFEQSSQRNNGEDYDDAKYRALLSSTLCPRIVYGQTQWGEISTSESVYTVDEIQVMLAGSPITAYDAEFDKYGAQQKVDYRVYTGSAELNQWIEENLTFHSSDTRVVSVDQSGNMTAVGPGTATITITYGADETSAEITVTVKEEADQSGTGGTGDGDSGDENPDDEKPGEEEPDGGNPDEDEPDDEEPGEENPDDEDPDEENPDEEEPDDEEDPDDENNPTLTTSGTDNGTGGTSSGAGRSAGESGINGDQAGSLFPGERADGGSGADTDVLLPLWTDPVRRGIMQTDNALDEVSAQLAEGEDSQNMLQVLDLSSLTEEQQEELAELIEEAQLEQLAEDESLADQAAGSSLSNTDGLDSGVYLSLGNVAGSGTVDGSGGKPLELEVEWTSRDTLILVASLVAMFAVGVIYRTLRFRKDTR